MPATIIPSITVGLLSSLSHMPPQTATKDVLSGHTARPCRRCRSQALRSSLEVKPPPSWAVAPFCKSFFLLCLPQALAFALCWLPQQFWKKLVQSSGVQFWCHSHLSKCHFDLPSFALFTGHEVGPYGGSPLSHSTLNCQDPTFLIFWIFFFLHSFPSLLICELHYPLLHLTMPIAFPKECAFSSSDCEEHNLRNQTDLYSDATSYISVLLASAIKWGYLHQPLRFVGSLISESKALTSLYLLEHFLHFTHSYIYIYGEVTPLLAHCKACKVAEMKNKDIFPKSWGSDSNW